MNNSINLLKQNEQRYKVMIRLGAESHTQIITASSPKLALVKSIESLIDIRKQSYVILNLKCKDRKINIPNVVIKKLDSVRSSVKYYKIRITNKE